MDGGLTTVNDCFVVIATAHDVDVSSAVNYSGWANSSLTNVVERADVSTSQGNGGGVGVATGIQLSAGTIGTSTVVNAATSPSWVSMVLAIPPSTPPPNDNFVNAENLVDGPTQAVQGKSYDATAETGESTTLQFSSTITKTQWWSFVPAIRQIVNIRVNEAFAPTVLFRALRGASVSTTSDYATPTVGSGGPAFGTESGRGVVSPSSQSGTGTQTPLRVQVMPDTPLMLQTGLWNFGAAGDLIYDVELESFTPPANDDFETAEENSTRLYSDILQIRR
jgi:hypothetical protein